VKLLDLSSPPSNATDAGEPSVDGLRSERGVTKVAIVLDEDSCKVRRIALPEGSRIPPCRMHHDVVFVVLRGRVVFTTADALDEIGRAESAEVVAPGAVFVPRSAVSRSMRAVEPSLVLALMCRCARVENPAASPEPPS
jgi:quercetin dioxygenase-like cupin family protein